MSARAKAKWQLLAPDLIARGVLTKLDVPLFEVWCEQWDLYEQARLEVAKHGVLIEGQKGNKVRNPAQSIARDALEQIRRIGALFGLSPSDRAGMKLAPTMADEPMKEFR